MKLLNFFLKISFVISFSIFSFIIMILIFHNLFVSTSVIIPYSFTPFDICKKNIYLWNLLKIIYMIFYFLANIILFNLFFSYIFKNHLFKEKINNNSISYLSSFFNLYIGNNEKTLEKIFIPENGLYQNMLITGTIGTGKTSSAMYPFVRQLIEFKNQNFSQKFGMLILDVKGNFYKQVKKYAVEFNRENDLIIIELGKNISYNPLHKPNLKPTVLANRLRTILTLISPNNTESFWLDKVEQILTECIKLCRLYNNGYVTFLEIHKLINIPNYYKEQVENLRNLFLKNNFNSSQIYDLLSSLDFFEKEFNSLDSRTLSILKSEISRITLNFLSDYEILNTFCPKKENLNFLGFNELLENGKIVVLNMNIAEYKNLSKIIATYLKLDFQSDVLANISKHKYNRTTAFICDEYHEYVTLTDADFFAQSREAKCINIVATQSYTSLLNTLKEQSSVKAITQNLVNKLWFRTDDIYTIEEAQKQLGKEEKQKISQTISENANETNFDYLTNTLKSKNSNISESFNTYTQLDFSYDTKDFTQKLKTFSCISFLSTGTYILPPAKLNMVPYFQDTKKKKINFNSII